MKVHQIIFLIWGIVFVFWMVRQFQQHNKRSDD
jgi:preprotein translocase subunit YajC